MSAHSVALGNMLADSGIWTRMVEVFENSTGSLALRLVEALKAAQSLGGDVRGQRSAALLVVRAERSGRPWRDNVVDLRVDDHPEPVTELDHRCRGQLRTLMLLSQTKDAQVGQVSTLCELVMVEQLVIGLFLDGRLDSV